MNGMCISKRKQAYTSFLSVYFELRLVVWKNDQQMAHHSGEQIQHFDNSVPVVRNVKQNLCPFCTLLVFSNDL